MVNRNIKVRSPGSTFLQPRQQRASVRGATRHCSGSLVDPTSWPVKRCKLLKTEDVRMSKRKVERDFDKRQSEWRATIDNLKHRHGKGTPRAGWESAYRRPGSRNPKRARGG